MGKTFVFGPDDGPDDPDTINLDFQIVGGVGFTIRHNEFGAPQSGGTNSVSIGGLNNLTGSAFNVAQLIGIDSSDRIVGTDFDDLIVWDYATTGIAGPRYLLPQGGVTSIDIFDMGGGNDVVNLTYLNDSDPSTVDIPYTANATIFGGSGSDVIWSGNGNDQIFGGGGDLPNGSGNETLFGGGGNDEIFGSIQAFNNISGDLGNDIIDGGSQSDGLWGGAGSDTIYGGPDTDYLYGGWGDNDVLVGGAGTDYYYWSRTDGQGDQIFDDFRGTDPLPGQQADNVLVVFPDFDPTEVNGDGLRTGSGVFETDHDLYDLAGGDDMVRLTDIDGAGGSMYRLTILTGDGATNYVEFDQRDVQTILLWNNDAAPGAQVIQTYTWDPVDGRYEFVS